MMWFNVVLVLHLVLLKKNPKMTKELIIEQEKTPDSHSNSHYSDQGEEARMFLAKLLYGAVI